jgi:hypothetical protein
MSIEILKKESLEDFTERFKVVLKMVVEKPKYTEFQGKSISRFVKAMYERKKSVCLTGLPSTSKSTLFEAMSVAICPRNGLNSWHGEYKVVSAKDFVSDFEDLGYKSFLKYDRTNVCIDDFGTSEPYIYHKGNKHLIFGDFMEHRYNLSMKRRVFTHLSTNMVEDKTLVGGYTGAYDIKEYLGDRAYSRFRQTHEVISMGFTEANTIDYRKQGLPISNVSINFDWKEYFESKNKPNKDEVERIMQNAFKQAKESFRLNGRYFDIGNSVYNYLVDSKDELILELSKDSDRLINQAKENVLRENKKLYDSLSHSILDMRNKKRDIDRQERGEFHKYEYVSEVRQLILNEYLKQITSTTP